MSSTALNKKSAKELKTLLKAQLLKKMQQKSTGELVSEMSASELKHILIEHFSNKIQQLRKSELVSQLTDSPIRTRKKRRLHVN